ncbi:hypothetical protein DW103_16810 [Parabacteroides sp. AM08-6]|nr:hypothetical protein DW103_16810 [Parabacteroides sp. AM08-6]
MELDCLFTNDTRPLIRPRFLIAYALSEAKARNLNQEESIDLMEKMLCQFMDKFECNIQSDPEEYILEFLFRTHT